MREDFLHYLWEFQKWKSPGLKTTQDNPITVLSPGKHNFSSGPDFFNARLVVGEQEWAGNVEIHINSSDWYLHGHETDPNYDNVILHVVWNHDTEIFRKDNATVPVLELRELVPENTLKNYNHLLKNASEKWINCEKDFHIFDDFRLNNWLERLYFERLEEKSKIVFHLLKTSSNNWEEVLFKMLARNFGLNVNGEAFLDMANSVPFSIIRKISGNSLQLEALFLGRAGLLEKEIEDGHYQKLQEEYRFLRNKFNLGENVEVPVKYFRLRPDNFPNIRLSQLASLYCKNTALFAEILQARNRGEFHEIFGVQTSEFWENHYTFQKTHRKRKKPLSKNFIDLLLINTIVPLKFCFYKERGKDNNGEILDLMLSLKKETNQTVQKFNSLRPGTAKNALQSQALLQMKHEYCDKNKCLYCNLGSQLLQT